MVAVPGAIKSGISRITSLVKKYVKHMLQVVNLATASGKWCNMVPSRPDKNHEVLNQGPSEEVCFYLLKVF